MKRFLNCFLLFAALLATTLSQAQDLITEEDYNRLIPYLAKENWTEAEKIALEYLNRFKGSDQMSEDAGIVRYMYLKSVSGLLGSKVISKEEAMKKLSGFEGKNIITPFNTFKNKGMFNYFKLDEDGTAWWKCSANSKSTEIHMFERFEMKDRSLVDNYQNYEGKNLRVSGIIKSINAEGNAIPRLKVVFVDSAIWDTKG